MSWQNEGFYGYSDNDDEDGLQPLQNFYSLCEYVFGDCHYAFNV